MPDWLWWKFREWLAVRIAPWLTAEIQPLCAVCFKGPRANHEQCWQGELRIEEVRAQARKLRIADDEQSADALDAQAASLRDRANRRATGG